MLAVRTIRTQADIAKVQGLSIARMSHIMALLRLDDSLQIEVIAGHHGSVSEIVLRCFACFRTKTMQRRAIIEHAKKVGTSELGWPAQRLQQHITVDATVRLVPKLAAQPMLSIYSVRVDTSYEDALVYLTVSFEFEENEWSERRRRAGGWIRRAAS